MKITTVIGARPQFIKASLLSRRFPSAGIYERILHTGQHYDSNMSRVFFTELNIPEPSLNLGVNCSDQGAQTARMLELIEADLMENSPDALLVYGDTNSTLAGALAASKLHIPVYHIEAGLRSFDRKMPEEVNRILTDHLSSKLFCPTDTAVSNLLNEGVADGVSLTGDVMQMVLEDLAPIAKQKSTILRKKLVDECEYYLATIHRAENTDNIDRLFGIMSILSSLERKVLMPLHPRTRKKLLDWGWKNENENLQIIDPVGYLDMLALIDGAKLVLTDSGGLQKEAVWMSRPCVTLRETTEWVETLSSGWNKLVGTDREKIFDAVDGFEKNLPSDPMKMSSFSADSIINLIKQ